MTRLLGDCQSCFRQGALWYEQYGVYLCPQHANDVSRWEESRQHLLDLITPAVAAWHAHWHGRGFNRHELEGTFENLEPYLKRIMDGA